MLAHNLVAAPGREPERICLFLHGILGSGANWRTFAKHVVEQRPEWGALLVDLRLHGDSLDFDGPHTLDAAANDLSELAARFPIRGIAAHSFGGKVALTYARDHDLDRLFIMDSTPSARVNGRGSESTQHIVDLLGSLPQEFPDRNAFTSWAEERGVSRPTAMWLAMNVRAISGTTRYAFRLDIAQIRSMLDDYFAKDLWPVMEHPRGERITHFVVGGKSDVVTMEDRTRAASCPRTEVHVLPQAGHWVHVDAPAELQAIVVKGL